MNGNMPEIHFSKEGKRLEMKTHKSLWSAQDIDNDITFVFPPNCGGKGSCRQCRAIINGEERLTCQTKIGYEDMDIETLIAYKDRKPHS